MEKPVNYQELAKQLEEEENSKQRLTCKKLLQKLNLGEVEQISKKETPSQKLKLWKLKKQ